MTKSTYAVFEWKDGESRFPIAIFDNREDAEAMINAFRDIEKITFDMPNSEGYWAFEGNDGMKFIRRLMKFEIKSENVVQMQWDSWESSHLLFIDKFKETNQGAWTRIYTPWEMSA